MLITTALFALGTFGLANLPTLLSAAGAVGVVTTSIEAAKAGRLDLYNDIQAPENETPKEKRKRKIKTYAKTAISSGLTIGSILLGDRLHVKRYAALGAAAHIIQDRYLSMMKTLSKSKSAIMDQETGELHASNKPGMLDKAARETSDKNKAEELYAYCKAHGIEPYDTHTGDTLWYEPVSETFFLASEKHVDDVEYNINRNFVLRGYTPFSEYLRFLGLDKEATKPGYQMLHWDAEEGETIYGYQWIDFIHEHKTLPDGPDYVQIFFPFEPHLSEK